MIKSRFRDDSLKLYCAFVGGPSILRQTLRRAEALVPREQIMLTTCAPQRGFVEEALDGAFAGRIIEQPANRGTAVAVLTAAAYAMAEDPEATLFILPCDCHVDPEEEFLTLASLAILYAEHLNRIVVLGAVPDGASSDHGWIEPCAPGLTRAGLPSLAPVAVRSIHERPLTGVAQELYRAGALWNTMICAAKARVLWNMGWRAIPDMMMAFEWFRTRGLFRTHGPSGETERQRSLLTLFEGLGEADLSGDLLERCAEEVSVLAMDGVDWSDLRRLGDVETGPGGDGAPHISSIGDQVPLEGTG